MADYKAAIVTVPGFEDIAAKEVEELISVKAAAAAAGIVTFQVTDLTDLCKLCYLSQSASSVLLILSEFSIGETAAAAAESLKKSLKGADFKTWFSGETTFKVDFFTGSIPRPSGAKLFPSEGPKTQRITYPAASSGWVFDFQPAADASHDFPTSELEAEAGAVIIGCVKSSTGFVPKVDLGLPAVTISIYSSGTSGFCGVMISPFDLSKREYRLFSHSSDIRGNFAYLLLRSAGYEHGKFLFDPFTRAGTIAVEAAISSSGFPVNYYRKDAFSSHFSRLLQFKGVDFSKFFAIAEKGAAAAAKKRIKGVKPKILSSSPSMQFVRSAEKNAKIAGINKLIRFSRLDIEWLDAKLDEQSVDLVVSYPPRFRSANDAFSVSENKKLAALYRNFFYHAGFFLKKKGKIVLLLKKGSYGEITSAAAAYRFKPKIIRSFMLEAAEFELVSFAR